MEVERDAQADRRLPLPLGVELGRGEHVAVGLVLGAPVEPGLDAGVVHAPQRERDAGVHAIDGQHELEAEAEGERLRAGAIMGDGGANLVALEAAKVLNLSDMTVSTLETDFLDIESIMKLLGARSTEE